ncbi:hypothetical protein MRX96_026298 [Rhipicephalus microplus]
MAGRTAQKPNGRVAAVAVRIIETAEYRADSQWPLADFCQFSAPHDLGLDNFSTLRGLSCSGHGSSAIVNEQSREAWASDDVTIPISISGGTRGSDDEAGDKSAAQTHEEPAAAVAAEASAFRDLSTRERRPRVPGRTGFRTSHPRHWRLFPRPPSASAARLHVARQPRALLLRRRRAGGGESGEGGTCAHAQRPVGWPRQPMSGGVPPVPREIPPGHDRGTGGAPRRDALIGPVNHGRPEVASRLLLLLLSP